MRVVTLFEGVHAELGSQFLVDLEFLHDREIGIEPRWPVVRIATNVSKFPAPGILKRPRTRCDVWHWSVIGERVRIRVDAP
jgi:hypothetical protein